MLCFESEVHVLGKVKLVMSGGLAAVERRILAPTRLPEWARARQVVLIGASVSEHWHPEVCCRGVEVVAHYEHDKTPVIAELLSRRTLPDGVIIKQCAAYFPLPLNALRALTLDWLEQLDERGVATALATVAPVTARHDRDNPGRLSGLLSYNDWVRERGRERAVTVLDLERPLRVGSADPHLDPRWATRDGLHLRHLAYRLRLDRALAAALAEMFAPSERR